MACEASHMDPQTASVQLQPIFRKLRDLGYNVEGTPKQMLYIRASAFRAVLVVAGFKTPTGSAFFLRFHELDGGVR